MNFSILENIEGQTKNPYAGKTENGEWIEGTISIDFLNTHFGGLTKEEIFTKAEVSEGLTLYFQWLDEQGLLTA